MSDSRFQAELRQLIASGQSRSLAKAIARLVREEQRRQERIDALRKMGQ